MKGSDFKRLARYLTRDNRGEVLDMRNLASSEPEEAAGEMDVAAAVSTRMEKPVMHVVVSYDPTDTTPSDDHMRADAAEVLDALGLADNQAVIIKHTDRDHPHFHIMTNRVGSNGKAISDSQSYPKAEAALRRIEARRGLSVTAGRHAPSPATGQRMTGPRGAADPRQHSALESVRQTLLTARSWKGLNKGLERDGWRLETVQRGKRPPGAVLIGPDGQRVAAGKIDRGATLAKLNSRLNNPKRDQDAPAPVSARAAAKPAALAKPRGLPGSKKRKKPKAGQRMKEVAGTSAELTTQLIGAAGVARPGGLIGAGRKIIGRSRQKRPSATQRLGM